MSKEAERFLEKIGSQNPYNLYKGERKPLSEVLQAYADKANKKLIAKIELLEACREYDASGGNRPDGYIVPNHYTGQRIDEMNKEDKRISISAVVCDKCHRYTSLCSCKEDFICYTRIVQHREEYIASKWMSKEEADKKGLRYYDYDIWVGYERYLEHLKQIENG